MSNKETYYFAHDYGARNDPKLQAVLFDIGVSGIGVYWCLIEYLYEQGGRLPLSACKNIAKTLHVQRKTLDRIIFNYGLFDFDSENFWSGSVEKREKKRQEISAKRRKSVLTRWRNIDVKAKENFDFEKFDSETFWPESLGKDGESLGKDGESLGKDGESLGKDGKSLENSDLTRWRNIDVKVKEPAHYVDCEFAKNDTIVLHAENFCNTIKEKKTKENNNNKEEEEEEESDFADVVIGDEIWVEVTAMQSHLSRDDIIRRLADFRKHCIAQGHGKHRDIGDFKSHFVNWLRIKLKDERNNNGARRYFDATASPEEYTDQW